LTRVLITGAARGLGREFAMHLKAEGMRVLGADVLEADLSFPRVLVDVTEPH